MRARSAKNCVLKGRTGRAQPLMWLRCPTAGGVKTMRIQTVLLANFVALTACGSSADAPAWAGRREVIDSVDVVWNPAEPVLPTGQVTLTLLWHTQPSESNPDSIWERPSEIRVAAHGVYVLDQQASRVYRLDNDDGSWIGSIGKPGGGPGEIDRPFGLVLRDSVIAIGDGGKTAVSLFDLDGRFLRTHAIEGFGIDLLPYGSDDLVVYAMVPDNRSIGATYRVVGDDAPEENIAFEQPPVTPEEYPDQDCMRTNKTTHLVVRLRCIIPLFVVLDESGSILRQVVVDVQPREVPPEEIDRMLEDRFSRLTANVAFAVPAEMRDRLRKGMQYENRYHEIRHDTELNIFVMREQTPAELGLGSAMLHVFSDDGRYLARVEAAESWEDFDIKAGVVYAIVTDPDTDLRSAAAYRLNLPEGAS